MEQVHPLVQIYDRQKHSEYPKQIMSWVRKGNNPAVFAQVFQTVVQDPNQGLDLLHECIQNKDTPKIIQKIIINCLALREDTNNFDQNLVDKIV